MRSVDEIRADLELAERSAASDVMVPTWPVELLRDELVAAVEARERAVEHRPAHGGRPGEAVVR
jgi:hypothetical protein